MYEKLPYYMAYPMPFSYDDNRTERLDAEYLKSLYPDMPRRILPYVEEECDRMEYENSMIYDRYPDKLQIRLMCRRACENAAAHEKDLDEERVMELTGVMLCEELYRRRCGQRRRSRRFW